MRGIVQGTVFSGHPLRTTFGNSMRVYYYTKYILHLSSIKKYKIYVCGDDTLLLLEKKDVNRFQVKFWKIYSNEVESFHGLG